MPGWLYDLVHFFDSTQLAPHGVCLLWQPGLIWLHVLSDGIIALAYFSIPLVLAVLVSKRPDIDFGWVLWAFVAFITACGATHVFGIWTLWFPDYAAEGAVKGFTALVSILTAIGLWPLLPRILALPSPEQLHRSNEGLLHQMHQGEAALRALEREKAERRKAEELLRSFAQHREFERLVAVTPDAVIVVDTQEIVQFANEAAVNLLDHGTGELVGNCLPFPLNSGEASEIKLQGGQYVGEVRVAECEWSDAPARLVVIRDITERKRIERLKDEFVSTVSHELRTPITSIMGSLGLLVGKAAGALPEPASRLLAIALPPEERRYSRGRRAGDRGDARIRGKLRGGNPAREFLRVGAPLRGPRSPGAGGHQPLVQRDQVLTARARGGRGDPQYGQHGPPLRTRLGPRYPGCVQVADIREVRAGRRLGRAAAGRQRARPQHRQAYRHAAGRRGVLRGRARRRHGLPCRPAALRRGSRRRGGRER